MNKRQQTLGQQNNGVPIDDSPSVILDAKIKALQAELDKTMTGYTVTSGTVQTRVAGLAELIANGDTTSSEYQAVMVKVETTSKALSDAKNQLARIQSQSSQNQTAATPDYQVLQIKIDTLTAQQAVLKDKLSKLYQQILGLDSSNDPQYNQALFSKTSVALAEAKKGLADLEKQLGFDSISSDLNLKVAQDKVNNLSSRMESLTEQLGSLVGNNANTLQTDYLVAGKPSSPFPILPPRGRAKNTLLGGAVVGIVLAWGLLNYKWIKKTWLSSGALKPEEGQET
jgi:chromosome segregation ATPase